MNCGRIGASDSKQFHQPLHASSQTSKLLAGRPRRLIAACGIFRDIHNTNETAIDIFSHAIALNTTCFAVTPRYVLAASG
jgi:hypothetical protein